MPWIKAHDTLPRHIKTMKMARALHVPNQQAVGHLLELWTWALGSVGESGDITECGAQDLAVAAGWTEYLNSLSLDAQHYGGHPDEDGFLQALVESGFVEKAGHGRMLLTNWARHSKDFFAARRSAEDLREANRRRQAEFRERHGGGGAGAA